MEGIVGVVALTAASSLTPDDYAGINARPAALAAAQDALVSDNSMSHEYGKSKASRYRLPDDATRGQGGGPAGWRDGKSPDLIAR